MSCDISEHGADILELLTIAVIVGCTSEIVNLIDGLWYKSYETRVPRKIGYTNFNNVYFNVRK